jgi:hypothetical protein
MARLLVALALACLVGIAVAATQLSEEEQFLNFMQKYNKNYGSSVETVKRLMVFKQNLQRIADLNAKYNPKTKFAVNKFADLTQVCLVMTDR